MRSSINRISRSMSEEKENPHHPPAPSPDDDQDLSHVRRPTTIFPPSSSTSAAKQKYARLNEPIDEDHHHSQLDEVQVKQIQVQQANGTTETNKEDKPPCLTNPLLLCIMIMGMIFILCGLLVGISLSLQPHRSDHLTLYNSAVQQWNHQERAKFARASFQVELHSPGTEMAALATTSSQRRMQQRMLLEDPTASASSSSSSSSSTAPSTATDSPPASSIDASSSSSSTSDPIASSSSSTGETEISSFSTGTSSSSSLPSTASPDATPTGASGSNSSSSSGTSSSSSSDTTTTSTTSSSSTGSTSVDSSSSMGTSTATSSTGVDSSTGSAPSINPPRDPWLLRNRTSLDKMTTGDVLHDMGVDVDKYQPLYFELMGSSAIDTASTSITPYPTSSYGSLPDFLLRNYSHPRSWLDREDFGLNDTRISFRGLLHDEESELSLSLPLLRQDLTKTSLTMCTTKLLGIYDPSHGTCLSYKQLSSICMRIKEISKDELLQAQQNQLTSMPSSVLTFNASEMNWNSTRLVFDTDELEGWSAEDDTDSTTTTSSATPILPHWSDVLGSTADSTRLIQAVTIPGCIRGTSGWQLGVYISVPAVKYSMKSSVPQFHGQQWHVMSYQSPSISPLSLAFSLAAATADSSHPEFIQDHDGSSDLVLISLNLASFNLSIRNRNDPYLMAQSLTRSSLWFGLPTSELIIFTVVLIFIGLILEVAPIYYFARWWTIKKAIETHQRLHVISEMDDDLDDGEMEEDEEEFNLSVEEDLEAQQSNGKYASHASVQMTTLPPPTSKGLHTIRSNGVNGHKSTAASASSSLRPSTPSQMTLPGHPSLDLTTTASISTTASSSSSSSSMIIEPLSDANIEEELARALETPPPEEQADELDL